MFKKSSVLAAFARDFAYEAHAATNHSYSEYLPYRFHLDMVKNEFDDFKDTVGMALVEAYKHTNLRLIHIEAGLWLHDTVEDARINYSAILQLWKDYLSRDLGIINVAQSPLLPEGILIAEIVRAVTNDVRGRNRAERMSDAVYEDIKNTPGAMMVKLADRLGNVKFSELTKSSMFEKYKRENDHFLEKLSSPQLTICFPMVDRLQAIFNK